MYSVFWSPSRSLSVDIFATVLRTADLKDVIRSTCGVKCAYRCLSTSVFFLLLSSFVESIANYLKPSERLGSDETQRELYAGDHREMTPTL